jgi:hypothetical protein
LLDEAHPASASVITARPTVANDPRFQTVIGLLLPKGLTKVNNFPAYSQTGLHFQSSTHPTCTSQCGALAARP